MRVPMSPVIKAIAAVNIAVAVIMLVPAAWEPMMVAGALFPARFTIDSALFQNSGFLLPVWLTPISSAFLHGGLMHVGLNMLMLAMIGPNLERVLGGRSLAVLYGAGILGAAATEVLMSPESIVPVVGASGAISALIAAHVVLFPREKPKSLGPIPGPWAHALKLMAGWVALNLMMGFAGPGIGLQIAIWSHIGGFAVGLMLTWPLIKWKYRKA
jgi:membrane associated rhomboid family serine protease